MKYMNCSLASVISEEKIRRVSLMTLRMIPVMKILFVYAMTYCFWRDSFRILSVYLFNIGELIIN